MVYDDALNYLPQFGALLGILAGGATGMAAVYDTGELWRLGGVAIFLAITVGLYVWKFHLSRKTSRG